MPEFVLPLNTSYAHAWFDGLPDIARGYIEAAFFCGVSYAFPDPDGETLLCDGTRAHCAELEDIGPANLDGESRLAMLAEAARFWMENESQLAEACKGGDYDLEQAGRDLWFSRNGHGVGFFDRGLGDIGDALQEAAGKAGERDLFAEPRQEALAAAGVALEALEPETLESDGWSVSLDRHVKALSGFERGKLAGLEAFHTGGAAQPLPNVGTRYGAPMGRRGDVLEPGGAVTVKRVTLDAGGYDAGGAYWGVGQPLWRGVALDGSTDYCRADDRAEAVAHFANGEAV